MKVFLYIATAFVLFLTVILFSSAKVCAEAFSEKKSSYYIISIRFLFIKYVLLDSRRPGRDKKTEQEAKEAEQDIEKQEKGASPLEKIKETSDSVLGVLKFIKKKLKINEFIFHARVGAFDAAETGIFTGAAYTLVYNILGIADEYFVLKKQSVVITPDFEKPCFDFDFKTELEMKIIFALIAFIKFLKVI